MTTLCNIATLLLRSLDANDTNNLALVNSEIFYGPPTFYISRSIYNRISPKRKRCALEPELRDFVERLKIIKPNLHLLTESLKSMDINTLTLQWKFPYVRSTTLAPELDLKSLTPHLAHLSVQEEGRADFCLDLFRGLTIPSRVQTLDFSGVHFPKKKSIEKFANVLKCASGFRAVFCSCCDSLTRSSWERGWTATACSFSPFPDESICENA